MKVDQMTLDQINDLVDEIFKITKKCSDCQRRKYIPDFYTNPSKWDGRDNLCKECRKARNRRGSRG